jgi:hypothetical protein
MSKKKKKKKKNRPGSVKQALKRARGRKLWEQLPPKHSASEQHHSSWKGRKRGEKQQSKT